MTDYLLAVLFGVVEGVTEFIPVSSTGHLILASELLGYDAHQWAVFNVVIQLGAILAVVVLYWRTFMAVLIGLVKKQAESWRFLRNIVVGVIPSAICLGIAGVDLFAGQDHDGDFTDLLGRQVHEHSFRRSAASL